MKKEIVLVVDNVRSTHNVGSFFRTADGFGIKKIFLIGITPFPRGTSDPRLPHLATKVDSQIHKTALGAERQVAWEHNQEVESVLKNLKARGFQIIALEQTKTALPLDIFKPNHKIALVVGAEIEGVSREALDLADFHIQIPMSGNKESFNVAVSAGIALFHISIN